MATGCGWWRPVGRFYRVVAGGGEWWRVVAGGGGWWSLLLGAEFFAFFKWIVFPKLLSKTCWDTL